METEYTFRLISYLIQALSAFICLLLVLSYFFLEKKQQTSDKLICILIVYYIVNILRWLAISSFAAFPYAYLLFYIGLMFSRVTGYHLVFFLTRTEMKGRFPAFHYIFPAIAALILVFILLYKQQQDKQEPEYSQCLYYSKIIFIIFSAVFTFLYINLGLRRLKRFRCEIDKYSADCERNSMQWIFLIIRLVYIMLSLVPCFLVAQFFGGYALTMYIIPLLWVSLSIVLYSVLCYNLLSGNYVMISIYIGIRESDEHKKLKLNRTAFENYMRKNRPYLNPKLKITNLLLPFQTNYHYMSEFINKEYKMNFSSYINTLRMQELEQIRCTSKYNNLSEVELIMKAGFSSYRSYTYFLKKQKEEALEKRHIEIK